METTMTVQDRIRKELEARDWTPYRLSQEFARRGHKISHQAIYQWLQGGPIDDENMRRLGDIFDKPWLELKYGRDELVKSYNKMMHRKNGRKSTAALYISALALTALLNFTVPDLYIMLNRRRPLALI